MDEDQDSLRYKPPGFLNRVFKRAIRKYSRLRSRHFDTALGGEIVNRDERYGELTGRAGDAVQKLPQEISLRGLPDVFDRFADLALEAVDAMVAPEEMSWVARVFRDQESSDALISDIGQERLELALAARLVPDLEAAAERSLDLVRSLLEEQPSAVTSKYLQRLSRCYLLGLDSECVLLSRSVLETAVYDAYRQHRRDRPATMRECLRHARELGWITAAGEKAGWTVWLRGNKAVHGDLDAVQDALGTVTLTMRVVGELIDTDVNRPPQPIAQMDS